MIDPDHHIYIARARGAGLISCAVVVITRVRVGWAYEGGADGGSGCMRVGLNNKIAGGLA